MRSFSAVLLAFLVVLFSAACSATPAAAPASQQSGQPAGASQSTSPFPLTITDDAGRQVTIATQPERIVSLSASNTEILFALGLGDRIVGVDSYSDYPPEVDSKPDVGSYSKPDLEKIVAAEPDLILATGIHLKGPLAEMEKLKLPVMVVDPRDVEGVLDKVTLLGDATGRRAEAAGLVDEMQAKIDWVRGRVKDAPPVRIFFELSPELHTAGPGSFVNDMIGLAGGENIAANAGKEWPQLNQEALFLANPQVILLADHGSQGGQDPEVVAARPGWKEIDAVKNGRVIPVDPDITNRPSPRLMEGLELMVESFHPEKAQ